MYDSFEQPVVNLPSLRPLSRLLVVALAVACSAPADALDAGDDAPDAPFDPCGRPCPSGQVCRSLRCVPIGDAGSSDVVDASRIDVIASFDGPSVACCPIDRFSTCGCVRVGGTMQTGRACRTVCGEGYPEFWRQSRDLNGCPVWLSSGIACRDAGDDDGALDAEEAGSSGATSDLGLMQ